MDLTRILAISVTVVIVGLAAAITYLVHHLDMSGLTG